MNKLRHNERCPIHKSRFCACHEKSDRAQHFFGPVRQVHDTGHPRGYREICSPSELRRRKHVLLSRDPKCWLCEEKFTEYSEVELEHKEPKGMGGARRDDHWDNLALAHKSCNREKGSKRMRGEAS